MPYYIYKIHPSKRLEHIHEFDAYRDAKTYTRDQRGSLTPEDNYTIRMIFAPSKEHAERLLKEVREARHLGEGHS